MQRCVSHIGVGALEMSPANGLPVDAGESRLSYRTPVASPRRNIRISRRNDPLSNGCVHPILSPDELFAFLLYEQQTEKQRFSVVW